MHITQITNIEILCAGCVLFLSGVIMPQLTRFIDAIKKGVRREAALFDKADNLRKRYKRVKAMREFYDMKNIENKRIKAIKLEQRIRQEIIFLTGTTTEFSNDILIGKSFKNDFNL